MTMTFIVTNTKDESIHGYCSIDGKPLSMNPWECALRIMSWYDQNIDSPGDIDIVSRVYAVSYRKGIMHIDAMRGTRKNRRVIHLMAVSQFKS